MDKSPAVIFDLDGCLSDDEWRLPLMGSGSEKNYKEYHENCVHDASIAHSVDLLRKSLVEGHKIIFLTGRPYLYMHETVGWIRKELGMTSGQYHIVMRIDSDIRTSPEIKKEAAANLMSKYDIVCAYDDRADVIRAYHDLGIKARILSYGRGGIMDFTVKENAADVLTAGSETFRERNAIYKDNWSVVGEVMAIMFPEGLVLKSEKEFADFSILNQIVGKLTRFATSGMTHEDSIHDLMVYAAIMESEMKKNS